MFVYEKIFGLAPRSPMKISVAIHTAAAEEIRDQVRDDTAADVEPCE